MKSSKMWLGLLVVSGLLVGDAWAEPVRRDIATLDGVTWIYTVDGGNATVTGVVAPAQSVLTMPSTLGGCPVTDIGYDAFAENNNIAVMVIPDSVRNIGIDAFGGCTSLQAVTIGNNVTNIAECAFDGCTSLSAVTFGKRVVTIGPAAFGACAKLTSVKLPDSVKYIGRDAFEQCGLTSVTLGKGLETIGDYAFTECERLETLTLPDTVNFIGEGAFYNAFFLRNITIPDSVTNLGNRAFGICPNLTTVVLSDNLTALENNLFSNCISLVEVTIPDNVQYIGEGVFRRCERLTELTIPANVTGIGDNAFAQCSGLATLHVPTTLRGALSRAGIPAGCTLDFYVNRQKALFDANGGTCGTPSRIYELDVPYASFPEATREHHAFAGWWTEAEGGERVLESDIVQAVEFRTLYAHWTLTEQVATFDPNGGQCDTGTETYTVGQTYGSLPVPTRDHHAFAGWWTEADGGEQVTERSAVTESEYRTLYAHWTLVEHVVTFDPNGGSCPATNHIYTVGQPYTDLPSATLEHYALAGWFTERDGGERVDGTIVPSTDTRTLYAHWTLVEQVVLFECKIGTCDTSNRTYKIGGNYSPLPVVTFDNPHFIFVGWYTLDGKCILEDTEVEPEEHLSLQARVLWFEEGEKRWVFNCVVAGNGELIIRFFGEKDKWYALQRTSTLGGSVFWHIVASIRAEWDGELELKSCPPEGWERGFYRVVAEKESASYLVVDMSGGQNAKSWPVHELEDVPAGGWTDEYKTTKLVLRRIKPGTFTMGCESQDGIYKGTLPHQVTVSKPFYIGLFEVTQKQWELALGNNPASFNGAMRPVERVNYNMIRGAGLGKNWPSDNRVDEGSFMGVLRAKTGLMFDLPMEAQWEFACRAGTTSALNNGKNLTGKNSCTNMNQVGRYAYNNGFKGGVQDGKGGYMSNHTTVGSYAPNNWGLYDMHGNVWEWTLDWFQSRAAFGSEACTDPVGANSGEGRTMRGGSWYWNAEECQTTSRAEGLASETGSYDHGFRVACVGEL